MKIKELQKKLEKVTNRSFVVNEPEPRPHGDRPTILLFSEEEYFRGREKENREIKSWLLAGGGGGGDDDDVAVPAPPLLSAPTPEATTSSARINPSILGLFGIGGIGKTTLIQKVCSDDEVKKHFRPLLWVSQDFTFLDIVNDILDQVRPEAHSEKDNPNKLVELLLEKLRGVRFLLVLDDIWDVPCDDWDKLWTVLRVGAKGSRVIITTRDIEKVKDRIRRNISLIIRLKELSPDQSLSLFNLYAFQNDAIDQEKEEIGKSILNKLSGVPLLIRLIASLLRKKDAMYWREFWETDLWRIDQEGEEIFSVLRISYQRLSSDQKRCFAYCSLSPKSYVFSKSKVIALWVAQDLVAPSSIRKRIEEKAGDLFDELFDRSFFERKSRAGDYIMHDLLHDLSIRVSKEQWSEKSKIYSENNWKLKKCKQEIKEVDILDWCRSSYFRTLFLNRYAFADPAKSFDLLCMDSLRYLRVLDFSRTTLKDLPVSICKLKQLRYLNLSHTDISRLPDAIFTLYNLLHLNLHECKEMKEIPDTITSLINLRQLILTECKLISKIPTTITKLTNLRRLEVREDLIASIPRIGRMTYLENLERFNVSDRDGFKITELKDLNRLKGKVCVHGLENVVSRKEAGSADLKSKVYLGELWLEWKRTGEEYDNKDIVRLDEEVLNGLNPPKGLQVLSIRGNAGLQTPEWLRRETHTGSGLFSKLTHLSLSDDCRTCRSPRSIRLEGLISLKSLCVDTPSCRPLTLELFHLKALEWLDLTSCSGLRLLELSGLVLLRKLVIWGSRSLQQRTIFDWPQLNTTPTTHRRQLYSPPALEKLHISNADQLRILDLCGLSSLQCLKIERCPALETLPLHGLSSLETFEICDSEGLTSLDFEGITSFQQCNKQLNNSSRESPSCPPLQNNSCEGSGEPRPTISAHIADTIISSSSLISSPVNRAALLPDDYEDILGRAEYRLSYTFKEELFDILCNSILLDHGRLSFSLDRSTGKKCYMVSPRSLDVTWSTNKTYWAFRSDYPGSRFAEVLELLDVCWLNIYGSVNASDLSPETIYAVYLVYKLHPQTYGFEGEPLKVSLRMGDEDAKLGHDVCLHPEGVHPSEYSNGWKTIALGEFYNGKKDFKIVEVHLWEWVKLHWKKGLIIHGIEFRPWYEHHSSSCCQTAPRRMTIFEWPQVNATSANAKPPCPPALMEMYIRNGNDDQLQMIDVCGQPSLQSMSILRCPALAIFPLHGLFALETLEILECKTLTSLDFEGLTSLKELRIFGCHNLNNFRGEFPPSSIEKLKISNCHLLEEKYKEISALQRTSAHISDDIPIGSSSLTSSPLNYVDLIPSDYKDILGRAKHTVSYRSKEELFDILCNVILLDDGFVSFSLDRSTGKKCYMISARSLDVTWSSNETYWAYRSNYPGSRFAEVLELLNVCWLNVYGSINTSDLSPETIYVAHLVFKLQPGTWGFQGQPLQVSVKVGDEDAKTKHVCLCPPDMQQHVHISGWKAIALGFFYTGNKGSKTIEVRLWETERLHWKRGLIIQGVEFKPWM